MSLCRNSDTQCQLSERGRATRASPRILWYTIILIVAPDFQVRHDALVSLALLGALPLSGPTASGGQALSNCEYLSKPRYG